MQRRAILSMPPRADIFALLCQARDIKLLTFWELWFIIGPEHSRMPGFQGSSLVERFGM
jgi:hypothetical protein